MRAAAIAAAAVALAGCAPQLARPELDDERIETETGLQQELAIREIVTLRDRLHRLSYQVATGGADVCGDHTGWTGGFLPASWDHFPDHLHDAAEGQFGLKRYAYMVESIAPDSPAASAGLQQFDTLLEFNGVALEDSIPATRPAGEMNELAIERDGERIELQYEAVRTCKFPVILSFDSGVNAFADGSSIVVLSGLMRALPNDVDLQAVIAHEYAHNFLGHIDAKVGNMVLGALLDSAVMISTGINPGMMAYATYAFSEGFEAEADYASLYMLANAGVPLDRVPSLWRRMSVLNPAVDNRKGDGLLRTHPANPERYVALEAAIDEINAKIASGAELLPNAN